MSNKDIIKYFYEVVVSENLLGELHKYISEDCVQRVGEKVYFVGTAGMKQHLLETNLSRLYNENYPPIYRW